MFLIKPKKSFKFWDDSGILKKHFAILNSKLLRKKRFTFPLLLIFLDLILSKTKLNGYLKRIEPIQQMKQPKSKKNVKKLLGALNYNYIYFSQLCLLSLAPLCNLLLDVLPFHWNEEQEGFFNKVEQTLTHTCHLALLKTKNPFALWLMPEQLALTLF